MGRAFKEFKITQDEVDKNFKVYKPSPQDQREAQKVRNSAFTEAIQSGAMLRSQLEKTMKERGMWSDQQEEDFRVLRNKIFDAEHKLDSGGFPLAEARELALEIRKWRLDMRNMLVEKSELANETVEGQADNIAFNYLVSACTFLVYDDGREEKYFASLDDYLEKSSTEEAILAATNLVGLTTSFDDNLQAGLTENKFLKEYGFIDDKLRLLNKDGKLVDLDGRLINENGQFVNENGELVDLEGRLLDDEGNYKVEKKPFLDEDGNEIIKEVIVEKKEIIVEETEKKELSAETNIEPESAE